MLLMFLEMQLILLIFNKYQYAIITLKSLKLVCVIIKFANMP